MNLTDLFGTEVQMQQSSVPTDSAQAVLQKLEDGTYTLVLAYEKTGERWLAKLLPLKRADELFPGMFLAYDEEKIMLIYTPVPRALLQEQHISDLKNFFYKSGIVPEGKVIEFKTK